jgi:4-hydroxy-tetrahydrodipicolinate reductase
MTRLDRFLGAIALLILNADAFTSVKYQRAPRRPTNALHMAGGENEKVDFYVMVNGMPGPMATAAAEACLRKGLKLSPVAMTGPDVAPSTITVADKVTGNSASVRLVPSTDLVEILSSIQGLKTAVGENNLLAIDYTHPSAVNGNARFYVKQRIPFVMGTTGGDRDQLMKDVDGHFCVIAPNMGKQIVAMQAALEDLATRYPAAFEGYKLDVVESHQQTKADTSGTAKAVINSIKTLAADTSFSAEHDIKMIRDEQGALDFGVPNDAMNGHAFHTYTLTSPDGTVSFQLQHNVAGRTIYAEGTADAVRFLAKKIKTEKEPRIFSMINVLEEGALV